MKNERLKGVWTKFWDMCSGGKEKEKWEIIYIQASEDEAKVIFYNRFGHNPERVTCTCCGEDYSISSESDIHELTSYHQRGCELEEYMQKKDVLFIFSDGVKMEEREERKDMYDDRN